VTIDDAMRDDAQRDAVLFEIRTWEFTLVMESHQIRHSRAWAGEYVYYLTEMWFTWPDFGYDAEHGYILN
jgi:hypothetical protein